MCISGAMMKNLSIALLALTPFLGVPGAFAGPLSAAMPDRAPLATPVAANCYSVGQQVAAERGAELARADLKTRGGQPVCVVVLLVPGKAGERPKRQEVVVPAN